MHILWFSWRIQQTMQSRTRLMSLNWHEFSPLITEKWSENALLKYKDYWVGRLAIEEGQSAQQSKRKDNNQYGQADLNSIVYKRLTFKFVCFFLILINFICFLFFLFRTSNSYSNLLTRKERFEVVQKFIEGKNFFFLFSLRSWLIWMLICCRLFCFWLLPDSFLFSSLMFRKRAGFINSGIKSMSS